MVVCEQHYHTVDTDTQTACWWHTVLECIYKVVVRHLRLVVAICLGTCLRHETLLLVDWVVQLGEGIAHFRCVHKELETFCQTSVRWLALCKWAYVYRVVVDEGWLNEFLFYKLVKALVKCVAPCLLALVEVNTKFFRLRNCLFVGKVCKVHTCVLLYCLDHGHLGPVVEVDCNVAIRQKACAKNFVGNVAEQTLSDFHHAFEIGVRLVKFDGCELWVVLLVHTFVAEKTANFVNTLKATNDKALEVKFRCYAHVHVDIQSVVVSYKWTCVCATWNCVQDWCFHFDKATVIQKLADGLHDATTDNKRALNIWVGNEVNVTLTVTCFKVAKSVVLFRKWQQGLGQKCDGLEFYGDFAHVCAENFAYTTNDVADIPSFECLVLVHANFVAFYVKLDCAFAIQNVAKTCFTHDTAGNHTAGNGNDLWFGFLAFNWINKVINDLLRRMSFVELGDFEWVVAFRLQLCKFVASDLQNFVKVLFYNRCLYVLFTHKFTPKTPLYAGRIFVFVLWLDCVKLAKTIS